MLSPLVRGLLMLAAVACAASFGAFVGAVFAGRFATVAARGIGRWPYEGNYHTRNLFQLVEDPMTSNVTTDTIETIMQTLAPPQPPPASPPPALPPSPPALTVQQIWEREVWADAENWIKQPSSLCFGIGNITMVTIAFGLSHEYMVGLRRNRLVYAAEHGYRVCEIPSVADPTRPVPWSKIPAMLILLPTSEYIVSMDADALITNNDIRFESMLDLKEYPNVASKDIVFTNDFDEPWNAIPRPSSSINTGVFMMKNTEWSASFMKRVYSDFPQSINHPWWEQQGVLLFRNVHPEEFAQHVQIIAYRHMNYHRPQWRAGSFIMHAAGGHSQDKYRDLLREVLAHQQATPRNIAWVRHSGIAGKRKLSRRLKLR
eukprot:jgi/Chlat1/6683/Chrsp49S06133